MRKFLIVAALVGASGVIAYRWQSSEPVTASAEHDAALVKDRAWIDHVPRHDRDPIQLFLALSPKKTGRGPIGVFHQLTQWEGSYEAFRYETDGDTMRVIFPQKNDRETLTIKATKCSENRMDYCLDISGSSRGVKRYYSRKGWEVKSVDEAEGIAAALAP